MMKKNTKNEMHMTSEQHSVYEMVRVDEESGMNIIYGYSDPNDLRMSADDMEPITVSRKVTHRRGKRRTKEQAESVCFLEPVQ